MIHRLDPRARIIVAVGLTLFLALSHQLLTLWLGLLLALLLTAIAQLPGSILRPRLLALNSFMLLLWLMLPYSGLNWTQGVFQALSITLKGNAMLLLMTTLLSTIELFALGQALQQLHVPVKLIQLLLLTVRYLRVMEQEYQRLRRAMTVRGFQAGFNQHSYRSLAYLVAMLWIKSFDRAERIVAAMKCRGFQGQFLTRQRWIWHTYDSGFVLMMFLIFIALFTVEWQLKP